MKNLSMRLISILLAFFSKVFIAADNAAIAIHCNWCSGVNFAYAETKALP
jgi:hypothetical protein